MGLFGGAGGKNQNEDLTTLLTKLYEMQEEVGAKPKTTSEEKRQKAENVAPVDFGKGRGGKKSGSRFLSLKSKVVDRLQSIHEMMEQTKGLSNSKDIISHQASIREELRQAQDDWNELNSLYQAEAKKKRSKFTSEELEIQQTLVQRLQQELEKVKQIQMRGYIGGNGRGEAPDINADILNSINVKTLDPNQNSKSNQHTHTLFINQHLYLIQ